MKIAIEKAVLTNALAAAARVVEKRNTIPILANVALFAEGASLRIMSTDLDIELSNTVAADIDSEGSTTVQAHLLSDIVKKLQTETVNMELDGNHFLTVSAGRSKFKLQCLPAGDFPDLTHGVFANTFRLPTSALKTLIARTKFAISTEETRYYLNGIYLHVAEVDGAMKLRAVATDGHRLAMTEMDAPSGSEGMPGIIVPRKTVGEIERLCENVDEVTIEISQNKIRLRAGEVRLTSKLIDGTFPDYARVIPSYSNFPTVSFAKNALAPAVDRVSTVSSDRGRAIAVRLDDNMVRLRVSNPDMGESEETFDIEYAGELFETGFNARYLQDILGVVSGKATRMSFNLPGDPAVFRDEDGEDSVFVLMPMRI